MLKNEEFIYEGESFKIINPNKGLRLELIEKIQVFTDEDGNLNVDDNGFKLYLLQVLVMSEDEDYDFMTKSIEDIEDIETNPSLEYEEMMYFIGSILSDLIISTYRAKILEIKQAHIQLLQKQTIDMVDSLNGDVNMIVRAEKRIEDEKRINKIRKEEGFDKVEKTSKIKNIFKNK